MKTAYSLLVLIATIGFAHAGGFGGPPPFTNGSPLQSGVDGTYQASVRGNNLSGVIRFAYSSGVQTTSFFSNIWVIFYEGQVFSGDTTVAINDGDISGVLETSFTTPFDRTSSTSTSDTAAGTASSSSTTVDFLGGPSGFFTASLDNNSPTGAFSGKGELAVVADVTTETIVTDAAGTVTNTTVNTEIIKANFKVKGVRSSLTAS